MVHHSEMHFQFQYILPYGSNSQLIGLMDEQADFNTHSPMGVIPIPLRHVSDMYFNTHSLTGVFPKDISQLFNGERFNTHSLTGVFRSRDV